MNHLIAAAISLTLIGVMPANAQNVEIFPNGSRPSGKGAPQNFVGSGRLDPQFAEPGQTRMSIGHVTFEPGARSAWHTHPAGQILIVTSGVGWVQQWGGERREMKPNDVVWIPAGVKHWHGATVTNGMSHLAVQEAVDGRNVDWLEQVTDDQYGKTP